MPKSKIKSIQGNGTWEHRQHGTMYSNVIEMEDGTVLSANTKSETPPYAVGDEVEYTVRSEHPQYGKSGNVKKIEEERTNYSGGRGNWSPEKDDQIMRQSCIKAASEWSAGREMNSPLQVIVVAQRFFDWCKTGELPMQSSEQELKDELDKADQETEK